MPGINITPQTAETLSEIAQNPDIAGAGAAAVNPFGGFINQAGNFLLGQTQAVQPLQPTAPQRSSAYGPVYIAAGVGLVLLIILAFVILKK